MTTEARRLSLVALAVIVLFSHALEWGLSYPLYPERPANAFEAPSLAYGALGAHLARFPPRPAGSRTVVLLGNSVYHSWGVAAEMQRIANREGRNVAFVNLAQSGCSIFDYTVQLARALSLKPDLVTIAFVNSAFSPQRPDGGDQPRFRTDADACLFDPPVVARLPASFYRRELSLDEAASALVAAVLPVARCERILRDRVLWELKRRDALPGWFGRLAPASSQNLLESWIRAHPASGTTAPVLAYPQVPALLAEIQRMIEPERVPVLWLRQQAARGADEHPDMIPVLDAFAKACPMMRVSDLHRPLTGETLVDSLHPAPSHRLAYAERHYRAILRALDGEN